jgi:hypothetical protein
LTLDEASQVNETMNYYIFKEFLLRLGFVAPGDLSEKGENDRPCSFVSEVWRMLGGEVKNHVTLNNTRIFLLAVMGTFLEPTLNKDQ